MIYMRNFKVGQSLIVFQRDKDRTVSEHAVTIIGFLQREADVRNNYFVIFAEDNPGQSDSKVYQLVPKDYRTNSDITWCEANANRFITAYRRGFKTLKQHYSRFMPRGYISDNNLVQWVNSRIKEYEKYLRLVKIGYGYFRKQPVSAENIILGENKHFYIKVGTDIVRLTHKDLKAVPYLNIDAVAPDTNAAAKEEYENDINMED